MEYSGAGGKLIYEKKQAKNLVTLSLSVQACRLGM